MTVSAWPDSLATRLSDLDNSADSRGVNWPPSLLIINVTEAAHSQSTNIKIYTLLSLYTVHYISKQKITETENNSHILLSFM